MSKARTRSLIVSLSSSLLLTACSTNTWILVLSVAAAVGQGEIAKQERLERQAQQQSDIANVTSEITSVSETAYYVREATTGFSKDCIYAYLGKSYSKTIQNFEQCPTELRVTTASSSTISRPAMTLPTSLRQDVGGRAFYQSETITGMTKQCVYDYLGSPYTTTTQYYSSCPASVVVSKSPRTSQSAETPVIGTSTAKDTEITAFYRREETSGMTKQCYYDYLSSIYTLTVQYYQACPASARFKKR
jgi:hypothetical protein